MLCVNARSVPAATADTIPISTAFQRVNAAFAPPGGVSTFQTEAPCTLGSHRSETAQAQPRISAFNYLVFPSDKQHQQQIQPYGPPPRFIGPLSRHEARPRNSSPPCPRCLQPRHLRRNCWNKIRFHGCNKPRHVKKRRCSCSEGNLGREVSFVEHNRGINHRAFTYNMECWIMLLAFPSDLWAVVAYSTVLQRRDPHGGEKK
jgi:hypothetical protein